MEGANESYKMSLNFLASCPIFFFRSFKQYKYKVSQFLFSQQNWTLVTIMIILQKYEGKNKIK